MYAVDKNNSGFREIFDATDLLVDEYLSLDRPTFLDVQPQPTKTEIISRLTDTEKALIWDSKDEHVITLVVSLVFADEPLNMQKVTTGFYYLESIGLLAQGRATKILGI